MIESSPSPIPQESHSSTKRKRDADGKPESKRATKRRRSKKPKDVTDDALDLDAGLNHAIGHMDGKLLADHVAQRTQRFQSDLSIVELEDIRVPASAIIDTTSWEESRSLDNLPSFLEKFAVRAPGQNGKERSLQDAPKAKGSPHTLVVAGAGLRAANVTRALRQFQTKEAKVEKLFAKHIKLKDAVTALKASRVNIGVGTPQRIMELLDDGTS